MSLVGSLAMVAYFIGLGIGYQIGKYTKRSKNE